MNSSAGPERTRAGSGRRASLPGLLSSGFFIVLPLVLIVLLLRQIFLALQDLLLPLLNRLPGVVFGRPSVRFLAVCLVLAMLLYLVGWLARTRVGRAIGRRLEPALLNRVPVYPLLRSLATGLADRNDQAAFRPALITVDYPGLTQLGLIVERHADGSATVFLPSSPNPASGTVVVVVEDRIRELKVPVPAVLKCVGGWGHGTAALLEAAEGGGGAAECSPAGPQEAGEGSSER